MLTKRPWIISLLLVLGLLAWFASGSMDSKAELDTEQSEPTADKQLITVRVREAKPQQVAHALTLYGRTEPSRSVTLKAETAGSVVETIATRGAAVARNKPLVRLALNDRKQQLEHAQAQLAQRQLEYEGAESLSTKGFQGRTQLAQRKSALKETQALIAMLRNDIDNTVIKAPFDGVMQERFVEVGDYVSIGDPIAQVADLNPVIVRGDVTQADIQYLKTGQQAMVTLSNGNQHAGHIRYIASISDEQTNTFRIEVSLDNEKGDIFGGLSAELHIPLSKISAVKINSSMLTLNDEGIIGIKWVKNDTVQFTPIDIVKNDSSGAWIRGIEKGAQIITVGQGFVREGDKVQTTPDKDENS